VPPEGVVLLDVRVGELDETKRQKGEVDASEADGRRRDDESGNRARSRRDHEHDRP
jgi:hypothetical protein